MAVPAELYRSVLAFYGRQMQLIDDGDVGRWTRTFAPDAVIANNTAPRPGRGRADILAVATRAADRLAAARLVQRHWFGMYDVRPAGGTALAVRCYALVVETGRGGEPRLWRSGLCRDLLDPAGDQDWLVRERRVDHDDVESAVPPPEPTTDPEETPVSDTDRYVRVQQFYARQMQLLDSGDAEGWALTFTEDGVFSANAHPEPVRGREAIAAGARRAAAELAAQGVVRRHWLGMLDVTDAGDALRVRSYALVVSTPRGGDPAPRFSTTCEDELVEADGGWLVRTRQVRRDDLA